MIILGIFFGQCSSISIYKDNKIIFASSEERYSRIKSDESYPLEVINEGLKFCKISGRDLDKIVIAGKDIQIETMLLGNYSNFSVKEHLMTMKEYWRPKLKGNKHPRFMELFQSKLKTDKFPFNYKSFLKIAEEIKYNDFTTESREKIEIFFKNSLKIHLGVDAEKISFFDHHTCHAAYALYSSSIRDDNSLIFTADAYGDGLSGTISKYDKKNGQIVRLKAYSDKDFQVGRIYRYTTLSLKMLPDEHEFKVMGLASYYNGNKAEEVETVLKNLQKLEGLEFKFNSRINNIYDYLEENLSEYRFDHIAAGLQLFTENILVQWIHNAVSEYNSDTVLFSGGISMNIKANMKISEIPNIKKFFVSGAGADQSLGMGACYVYAEMKKIESQPLENLYLGSFCNYTNNEIEKLSKKYHVEIYHNEKQIVEKLLDGKIIATSFGRAEMGPRALCNRSIIGDPRKRENIEKINHKIKNRDFWMPFAPVVLFEEQHKVLKNPKNLESPYMTIGFETINGKEIFPAAVHQADGSSRPFIVKKEVNPRIWNTLNIFHKETGVPVLINTSFNLHGCPIVNSFDDAIYVFENSGLDCLWLENHIIEKRN